MALLWKYDIFNEQSHDFRDNRSTCLVLTCIFHLHCRPITLFDLMIHILAAFNGHLQVKYKKVLLWH